MLVQTERGLGVDLGLDGDSTASPPHAPRFGNGFAFGDLAFGTVQLDGGELDWWPG